MAPVKELLAAWDRVREKRMREEAKMSYETCTKDMSEPCKMHPVDCDNCVHGAGCQQKADMRAHPDKIKSCPGFRPKKRDLTSYRSD